MNVSLRTKLTVGAAVVILAAAGGGIAAATLGGSSSPSQQLRLVTPSGVAATTAPVSTAPATTLAPSTTIAPATTLAPTTTTAPVTTTTTDVVSVPVITGETVAAAGATLSAAGLSLGYVAGDHAAGGAPATDCWVNGATITMQNPRAGAQALRGSTVNVDCTK